jgi:methanogenic corrinoid protein MtbC1
MSSDFVDLLADLKEQEVIEIVKKRLDSTEDPMNILNDSRRSMGIVGERFAAGEYFLPELVFSGELLKQITELVKPKLRRGVTESKRLGTVVIGTVADDIHDIGLNIVAFMLDVNGFEVYNLGVDVPPERFVEKIKETNARIVGLSGFLTLVFNSMKETVDAIEAAGLRDKVKIMIGGGQIDEAVRKYTGADAYGLDAMAAVTLAKEWIGGK